MCEAEDRLEKVEEELEELQEKIASGSPDDFAEAAAVFKKESWAAVDPEAKLRLMFLAECFELLSGEPRLRRFELLAEKVRYARI